MAEFDGKSVIVTGGALGIGGAASEAFAREGANVTILDWNEDAGNSTVSRIESAGGKAQFVHADAGTSEGCQSTVDAAVEGYGGVDIVFNNVGIQPPDSYVDAVDLPEETWDKIIDVNLKSRFLMAKFAIPHMRKAGGGVIISSASVQGLQSMGGVSAYAASKGGDLSLMRQMSLDFAPDNIRVVCVNPGAIDTPMVRNAIQGTGGNLENELISTGQAHPLGRIGQPEDIANMVLFLASDRASFVTGSYFNVDGGLMAMGAWANTVGADGSK
ncbi:MAG: short-chain dehydrogenase [Chloroflexi bacterium]|nr:short-chain dehydrogenase [Chloroflexota bacterium]|tara:strand:+ start:237 stop:1052 length:816 start_codon:yes stop_codon:yes gene_type:complete